MSDTLFDSIAARVDQEESSGLKQSAFVGVQKNPDELAGAMRLGKRVGVPADIAVDPALRPGLEQKDKLDTVQQKLQDLAPKTRQWLLSNPDNTTLAQDDLSTLHGIQAHFSAPQMGLSQGAWDALQEDRIRVMQEKASKNEGSSLLSSVNSSLTALPGLGYRVLGTALAYPEAAVRALGDVTVNYQNQDLSSLASKIAGEFTGAMGEGTVSGGLNALPGKAQAAIQAPQIKGPSPVLFDRQTGRPFANPDYTMWGRSFANTVETMPGQLATFAGTGGLAPALMGVESAQAKLDSTLSEMQAQHPNTPLTLEEHAKAIAESMGAGAINYAVMGKMPAPAPSKSIAGVVAQATGRAALLGTGMTVFENELSRLHEPDRNILEGLPQSLLTMGLWEGIGAYHQIGQVRDNMRLLDGLENLSQSSKLNARMAEKFQEFVKDAAAGTGKESVGVPPEAFDTYFQSMGHDPEVIAKALKIPNYMEAKLSGADVQIPVEQWVSKIANTHHNESLIRDARFSENELTLNEVANEAKDFENLKTKALETDKETQALPEFKAIRDELKARYMAAGETSPVAETYATDGAKVFTNLARQAGMTPGELFAHYAPKIMRGAAPEVGALEQAAFHGSPYQFDKFSLEHMGEGEGVQAYGHGLYFAGDKEVAEYYRRGLTRDRGLAVINGLDASEGTLAEQMAGKAVISTAGGVEAAKEKLALIPGKTSQEALGILSDPASKIEYKGEKGQLYEVDIPEDDHMLLWDKPLSEQPEAVRDAILKEFKHRMVPTGTDENGKGDGYTGEQLYKELVRDQEQQWENPPANPQEAASKILHSLGLAGIKYEDGSSRGKDGEKSYNYVVFDDAAVKIAKTFYQTGQRSQTGTPEFKKWFGESKAIDKDGKPLAVSGFYIKTDQVLRSGLLKGNYKKIYDYGFELGKNAKNYSKLDENIDWGNLPDSVREYLDGSWDHEATTAYYDAVRAGFRDGRFGDKEYGASVAKPVLAERIGGVPESKTSYNFRDQRGESGLSVLGTYEDGKLKLKNDGTYALFNPGEHHIIHGFESETRTGSDGEPLLLFPTDLGPKKKAQKNLKPVDSVFYQSQGESARGWFTRNPDGTFVVGKTPEGDFSTFIHEPAHAYLEMFRDLVKQEGASESLKSDAAKIADFLGAKDLESLTVDQHEKWARANEAYAREGKAPSEELRPVFQRFKVWLQSVYRHVEALNVDLSDDIRGVFDRMRATDQEIEAAKNEVSAPRLFTSPEEAGWTEKQFQSYAREKDMELDKAKEEVLRRMNEAALRSQTHEWRMEQSEVRNAVSDVVDARPEQQAIKALRKGSLRLEDGTEMAFTLDKESLVKQFGEDRVRELQRKHPNLYRKEGGALDAEAAAEFLGYDSGESLIQALESADRRSSAIDTETRRVMTERHGDIRYDGTIKDVARLAVENDSLARSLRSELKVLRAKAEAGTKADSESKAALKAVTVLAVENDSLARSLRSLRSELKVLRAKAEAGTKADSESKAALKAVTVPSERMFREAAKNIVEGRVILDLDTNAYLNNQRRYSREAFKKNALGEFKDAAEAKQKELLNHYLYLEGVKAQAEAKKIATHADRLSRTAAQERIGAAHGSYLEQVNNLLERFSFKPETRKATEARRTALSLFVRDLPEGSESIIDDALLDEGYRKNYKAMTIQELRTVHDALRNIETLARHEREFLSNGKAVAYASAVQEMVKSAETNNKRKLLPVDKLAIGTLAKGRNLLQGLDVGLKKVEWLVDHLDGGDINGPWRKYLFTPIAEAQYRERELHQRVEDKLIAAMQAMPKDQRMSMLDAVSVPGVGTVTRKYILSAAMNAGNESNRSKMLEGMKWDEPTLDRMFSHLNKADWEFVQKTWDHIGELWPDIVALQERATGVPPVKVEPKAFTVQTPEGPVEMRGGYFPLAYDPQGSRQGVKQESVPLGQLFETGYVKATTSKGHTMERVKFSAPLIMDFEHVITRHLAGVIKDLSHREAVMSINRLISNQEVRNVVQETMGPEYEQMLSPWLRGVVNDSNQGVDGLNRWDKFALHLRSNVVVAGLGFRASSVLIQATDWGRAMDRVKFRYLGSAILEFSANPAKMVREVRAMSKEMEGRPDNLDRDLRAQWQQLTGQTGVSAAAQRFAMKGLSMADAITSVTTWKGAYNQARDAKSPPEQAVMEADRAVRLTLMSGAPKDLVAIQRKKDVGWKLATMFLGDSTAIYGILGDMQHKVAKGQDVPKQAARLVFSIMLPAIAAQLIKGRGPQDDEDKLWWATKQALLVAPSSIPILRDVAQAVSTGRDYQFSPVAGGLAKAGKAAMADWKLATGDENQTGEDAFMKSMDAASILFGLPLGQPLSTLKYVRKVQKGEENPESNTELVKNLVLGAPPKGK